MTLTPDTKARHDVDHFGWHCIHVAPQVGESGARFSYTIGLHESYGHPEIMIFGLSPETTHAVLYDCEKMIKAGTRFPTGEPVLNVLADGFPILFKRVKKGHFAEYLGAAMRFYGKVPFEAVVLFWPDKDHRFPWESEHLRLQAEALNLV